MEIHNQPLGARPVPHPDEFAEHLEALEMASELEELLAAMESLSQLAPDTLTQEDAEDIIHAIKEWGKHEEMLYSPEWRHLAPVLERAYPEGFHGLCQLLSEHMPGAMVTVGTEWHSSGTSPRLVAELIARNMEDIFVGDRLPKDFQRALWSFRYSRNGTALEQIGDTWKALDPDRCVLFDMGDQEHAILGMLVRQPESERFTLWVGNSGQGIGSHPHMPASPSPPFTIKDDDKTRDMRYQALCIRDITADDVATFLTQVSVPSEDTSQYVTDLYMRYLPEGTWQDEYDPTKGSYRRQAGDSCASGGFFSLLYAMMPRNAVRTIRDCVRQDQVMIAMARLNRGASRLTADLAAIDAASRLYNRAVKAASASLAPLRVQADTIAALWAALPRQAIPTADQFVTLAMKFLGTQPPGLARNFLWHMSREALDKLLLFVPYMTSEQRAFLRDIVPKPGERYHADETLFADKADILGLISQMVEHYPSTPQEPPAIEGGEDESERKRARTS